MIFYIACAVSNLEMRLPYIFYGPPFNQLDYVLFAILFYDKARIVICVYKLNWYCYNAGAIKKHNKIGINTHDHPP